MPKRRREAGRAKDPWVVGNLRQVAKFFRTGHSAVRHWFEDGAPGRKGEYDLAAIMAWRDERRARAVEAEGGDEALQAARTRKEIANANRVELAYKRDIRQVVDRQEMYARVRRVVDAAVAAFERAPGVLPTLLSDPDVEKRRAATRQWANDERMQMYRELTGEDEQQGTD